MREGIGARNSQAAADFAAKKKEQLARANRLRQERQKAEESSARTASRGDSNDLRQLESSSGLAVARPMEFGGYGQSMGNQSDIYHTSGGAEVEATSYRHPTTGAPVAERIVIRPSNISKSAFSFHNEDTNTQNLQTSSVLSRVQDNSTRSVPARQGIMGRTMARSAQAGAASRRGGGQDLAITNDPCGRTANRTVAGAVVNADEDDRRAWAQSSRTSAVMPGSFPQARGRAYCSPPADPQATILIISPIHPHSYPLFVSLSSSPLHSTYTRAQK
jgi:hypothetical protein